MTPAADTPSGELILYQTEDGRTSIECRFEGETIRLTQALIAELFQKDVRTTPCARGRTRNEGRKQSTDRRTVAPQNVDVFDTRSSQRVCDLRSGLCADLFRHLLLEHENRDRRSRPDRTSAGSSNR